MESYSVCQLQKDMRFEGFLLVRSAEKRKDVKGNDYVDMNVTDRTGEINCKLWNWDSSAEMPEAGSTVKLRGTVQEYNGRLQLRVEKWRKAEEADRVDMSQLVPGGPADAPCGTQRSPAPYDRHAAPGEGDAGGLPLAEPGSAAGRRDYP